MIKSAVLFFSVLLLVGCTTVPVKAKFPDVPPILMEKCPQLSTIDQDTVPLSQFLKTVTDNYTKYHECAKITEAWQQWHAEQKKIYEK